MHPTSLKSSRPSDLATGSHDRKIRKGSIGTNFGTQYIFWDDWKTARVAVTRRTEDLPSSVRLQGRASLKGMIASVETLDIPDIPAFDELNFCTPVPGCEDCFYDKETNTCLQVHETKQRQT